MIQTYRQVGTKKDENYPSPSPSPTRGEGTTILSPFLKGRGRGGGWKILLSFLIFVFLFFTSHFSLSHAESLSDINIAALESQVKEYWGRDPFIKYEDRFMKEKPVKEELPLGLKLDGIISDGKKALAIINGGFYRKNDRVNEFLIIGINRNGVWLEKDGSKIPLMIDKFTQDLTRERKK